jgi:hypothetical protein
VDDATVRERMLADAFVEQLLKVAGLCRIDRVVLHS